MPLTARRLCARLALAVVLAAALTGAAAAAAGPFGVGLPEPAPSGGGWFPSLFAAIAGWQSSFYRELTATLKAMKSDGTAGLWLAGLSFLYGILHAVGPGHGKAVISAYVLANRESARNGALLAMVSALAQAVMAVSLVSVAAILLGATSIAMTAAAEVFEAGSFALITALGVYLVARKVVTPLAALFAARYAPVIITPAAGPLVEYDLAIGAACRHGNLVRPGQSVGAVACGCGHAHLPTPELASGRLDWRKAASAIVAVGFRPCTGALIVLVFALSQGIYAAGVLSAFVMALGTGLTVAVLTLLAVTARGLASRLSNAAGGTLASQLNTAVEMVAAVVILLFGLTMFAASLYSFG